MADDDDRAGQKLDPSYQQAYLYAPPGVADGIPAVAAELIRSLRDPITDYTDESGEPTKELYKKAAPQSDYLIRGETTSPPAADATRPEERDASPAAADPTAAKNKTEQARRPVADAERDRPRDESPEPSLGRVRTTARAAAPAQGQATRRPSAQRDPLGAALDRPMPGPPADADQREARQGRAGRGLANADPGFYPPQRSLNPYGAAAMRPTGVPVEQFEEGAAGGSGARGQSHAAGGGRPFGGPIDPYGGYTRSARPIGGAQLYGGGAGPYGAGSLNPYGGAGPQGSAGRARLGAPGETERGAPIGPAGGAAAPNPFGPLPAAPVPFIQPPGLRFN